MSQSQNEAILAYLMDGNSITPIDALTMFGSFRLGARIKNLRDLGHKIETNMVSSGGKRYASYFIKSDLV